MDFLYGTPRFLLQVIKYAGLRYRWNQNPFPQLALYSAYMHASLFIGVEDVNVSYTISVELLSSATVRQFSFTESGTTAEGVT